MDKPQILRVRGDRDRAAVFVIRGAVFVAEQRVPIAEEWDERDTTAEFLLAKEGDVPVGTVRLVDQGAGVGLLGRMAVLPEGRGKGVGGALVRAVGDLAGEMGLKRIELHAQTHALGFYERLGYVAHGPEFLDAGIPHRHMEYELSRT